MLTKSLVVRCALRCTQFAHHSLIPNTLERVSQPEQKSIYCL